MRAPTGLLLLALMAGACTSSPTSPSQPALSTCSFNIGDSVQPPGSMGAHVPELGESVSGFGDKVNGGGSSISIETSKGGVVTITTSKNGSSPSVKTCELPATPLSSPASNASSTASESASTSHTTVTLQPGETRTFPPGELPAGDMVECRGSGVGVPEAGGVGSSSGVSAVIRPDGSVVARCSPGAGGNA